MATTMSYDDYNTYLRNKKQAETEHAQTGQWNAALGQQNQALRDKYGMGADNQNAAQFENNYAWMYNGQNNQQQSTPYDTYYGNVKSQYDAAMQQAQAAREAQTKQAIAGIEAQRPGIQQSAEEQARQAYVNNQRNVNMLPWQMKMLGLTGGASESSMVGENARFGNLHGQILSNRENQLRELENAKRQAQMQGDYDVASLQGDFARKAAEIYQQLAAQQLDNDIYNMRWNQQTGYEDRVRQEGYGREDTLLAGERDWQEKHANIQAGLQKEMAGYTNDLDYNSWQKKYDYQTEGDYLDWMRRTGYQGASQPKTTTATTTKKSEPDFDDEPTPKYDYQSLTKLGYGPMDPQGEKLNVLIQSGQVVVKQRADGTYYFEKAFVAPRMQR